MALPVRHAHVAAATPHTHDHAHTSGHVHQEVGDRPDAEQDLSEISHFHLSWFFLDCWLPDRDPGGSGRDEANLRIPPTLLAASVSVDLSPGAVGGGWLPIVAALDHHSDAEYLGQPRAFSSRNAMPVCGPLCDAARQERSGVHVV